MTNKTNNLYTLFSMENTSVVDAARKAGKVTSEVIKDVAREQIGAVVEIAGLSVQQFEALRASKNFDNVIIANQAWFNGSVEILTTHANKSFEIVREAAGGIARAPKKTARRKTTARKKTATRNKATARKKVTARKKTTRKAA